MEDNLTLDKLSIPFGIYIKTFKPDYHLTRALIASVEHFHPNLPIIIIPDDDFQDPTLFGHPTMQSQDPLLLQLRGYFKKLWCYFGPLEQFIYLDSDSLMLRKIDDLLELMQDAEKPFVYVCNESKTIQPTQQYEPSHRKFYELLTGDLDLLKELDPQYNFEGNFPFNSSVMISHRGAVNKGLLEQTFREAQKLHAKHNLPPLYTSREGLFMGDQGLINYLLYKGGVKPVFLQDLFLYGKKSNSSILSNLDQCKPYQYAFITWPGYPRPSVIRRDQAGGDLWNYYFATSLLHEGGKLKYIMASLVNGGRDIKKRFLRAGAQVKKLIKTAVA